jgi:ketosteroid isomerase-like protein
MSQEIPERWRLWYSALSSGDVDGVMDFLHNDIEYLPFEESEAIHGPDAVRRYVEGWLDTWDSFQAEPTEFLGRGDQVVVGEVYNGRARAAASRSPCRVGRYASCAMTRSFAGRSSWTGQKPSKPPGCRSSSRSALLGLLEQLVQGQSEILRGRCRRRTWRS